MRGSARYGARPQAEHRGSREGGVFPAMLHDLKAAVRWVRRFASTPAGARLDPARIGARGPRRPCTGLARKFSEHSQSKRLA